MALPTVDAPYGSKAWEQQLASRWEGLQQMNRTSYVDPASINIQQQQLDQQRFQFLNSREYLTAPLVSELLKNVSGRFGKAAGAAPSYGDVRSMLQNRYGTAMGMLQGYGSNAMAEIGRSFDYQSRQALQQLQATGLANSTIAPTIMAGYEKRKQEAMNQVREQLAGLGLQTHLQGSGDVAGYMERQQMSPALLAQLAGSIG